jgi:hypothetical protein
MGDAPGTIARPVPPKGLDNAAAEGARPDPVEEEPPPRGAFTSKVKEREPPAGSPAAGTPAADTPAAGTPAAMFNALLANCIDPRAGRDLDGLVLPITRLQAYLIETKSIDLLNEAAIGLAAAAVFDDAFTRELRDAVAREMMLVGARTVAQVLDVEVTFESPSAKVMGTLREKVRASALETCRQSLLSALEITKTAAEAAERVVASRLSGDIDTWLKNEVPITYQWPAEFKANVMPLCRFDVGRAIRHIFRMTVAALFAAELLAGLPPDFTHQAVNAIQVIGVDRLTIFAPCRPDGVTTTYPHNDNAKSKLTRGRFTSAMGDCVDGRAKMTQGEMKTFLMSPAVAPLLLNIRPKVLVPNRMSNVVQDKLVGGHTDVLFAARHVLVDGVLEMRADEKITKKPDAQVIEPGPVSKVETAGTTAGEKEDGGRKADDAPRAMVVQPKEGRAGLRARLSEDEKAAITARVAGFMTTFGAGEPRPVELAGELDLAAKMAMRQVKLLGRTKDGSEQCLRILASGLLARSGSGHKAGSELAGAIKRVLQPNGEFGGAAGV